MLRRKIILLVTICFCVTVLSASAEVIKYSKKIKNIGKIITSNNVSRSVEALAGLSQKERIELAFWTLENYEKVPPIYYIFLTDDIFTINPKKAAELYFIGRLRATEDIFMCTDETNRSQISIYPMLAPNTMEYLAQQKDKTIVNNALKNAIDWDKTHPKRVNPVWACYHGLEAYDKIPSVKPQKDFVKIQEEMWDSIEKSLKE